MGHFRRKCPMRKHYNRDAAEALPLPTWDYCPTVCNTGEIARRGIHVSLLLTKRLVACLDISCDPIITAIKREVTTPLGKSRGLLGPGPGCVVPQHKCSSQH